MTLAPNMPSGNCPDPIAAPAAIAVALDAHGVYCTGGDRPTSPSIPPAALAPSFDGEPVRVDLSWPADPRGSGDPWPGESRVPAGDRPARCPIAHAWDLLARGQSWSYTVNGFSGSLAPARAIAAVLAHLVRPLHHVDTHVDAQADTQADADQLHPCVLVMPAGLSRPAIDALGRALRASRLDAQLVARHAAAAARWAMHHKAHIGAWTSRRQDRPMHVLVLHLGLTDWQATTMALRFHDATARIEPAHDLAVARTPGGYGLDMLSRLAARSLEMSYRQATPARIWQLMWCTPWMRFALDGLSGRATNCEPHWVGLSAHARSAQFLQQQCRQGTRQILARGPHPVPDLMRDVGASPSLEDLRDWITRMREALREHTLDGAIVTGAMASIAHEEGDCLAGHLLGRMSVRTDATVVEGRDIPLGAIAEGALLLR